MNTLTGACVRIVTDMYWTDQPRMLFAFKYIYARASRVQCVLEISSVHVSWLVLRMSYAPHTAELEGAAGLLESKIETEEGKWQQRGPGGGAAGASVMADVTVRVLYSTPIHASSDTIGHARIKYVGKCRSCMV